MKMFFIPLLTSMIAATAALAAPAAPLRIEAPWMRALPGSVPAGGYFVLHNDGKAMVTLTGAQSPACGMLMLHLSENQGGMSSMRHVDSIDVAPGGTLEFKQGGYHLMCMQPGPAIKPGASVPVTLTFKDGATVTANFPVRDATGK
ncbi:MAG: copper chaperone PCu(A)C [Alphaproteobacteria bacterium]|nr:copper chaperone PCu(A)C [Alphaproteobacteria bacterium]